MITPNEEPYRELIAKSEVALSVALGDFDSVVDVVDVNCIVSDVLDGSRASAALQILGEG